ncbi:hypothetical protein QUF72_11565 [Desulfobacterales bacterium HSG2]|nr:hypothetical protein [Desulfobacterales bacterium HSG2]
MKLSYFFSKIRSLFLRIRSLFLKDGAEEGVIIVEREEFAQDMREKFRGNTELLKAIERCMNRKAERHEYVSLAD